MTHNIPSQTTFRALCLTSSCLFMVGITTSFVLILPFVTVFSDNRTAVQVVSVVAWTVAGSSILPELCIDLLQRRDGTTTTTQRRPDYGFHSRYGRAKNIVLCLVQSVLFGSGCAMMGLAEYRRWATTSSSSDSDDPSRQVVVDWTELYLIAACCMTTSALLATCVTGCGSCCRCCCSLEVPLRTTTTTSRNSGNNVDGTPSTTTIDQHLHPSGSNIFLAAAGINVIVGNGFHLGASLLLLFAYVTGGWCNECYHGYIAQMAAYGCWITASILWTIADAMLPTGGKQQNQHGLQHDDDHQRQQQQHDPTTSVDSSPSGEFIVDQEIQQE